MLRAKTQYALRDFLKQSPGIARIMLAHHRMRREAARRILPRRQRSWLSSTIINALRLDARSTPVPNASSVLTNRRRAFVNPSSVPTEKPLIRIIAGWTFFVLGVLGLFLPILQGWLFISIGAVLLAPYVPFFQRILDWVKKKFPQIARHADKLANNKTSGKDQSS